MARLDLSMLVFALLAAPTYASEDIEWPSWRGPSGNGHAAADANPPVTWSEESNVRWKVELPGLGNSTPIVVGDQIFLTTAIDIEGGNVDGAQPEAPNADHTHEYIVLALDRATGEEDWRTVVTSGKPHEKGHNTGSHASPSLATDGELLVTYFGSRGVHVLDLEGELLWSKDHGDKKTLAGFGEGSTPALAENTIVVQWDHEGPSFVIAYDLETGDEKWRTPRETNSSWGSPVIARVGDQGQVVLAGSDTTRGYDLATGELVWSCGGMSKNPVNSPVIEDGVAYVMNSYKGNIIQAIGLGAAQGDLGESDVLWARRADASYVPLPIAHEGRLYYLRDSKGVLTCLDAKTGEPHYTGQRLGSVRVIHASPVIAAGRLYYASREGIVVVVKAGDEFEILATNELEDMFDASPVVVGAELYLRGRSHLYCLAESE